jgi:Ca-activated chloride channel family protein
MIEFALPWMFLLLPLPWLLRRLLPPWREARSALQTSFLDRLSRLTGREAGTGAVERRPSKTALVLQLLTWLAVVTALAGPQRLEEPVSRIKPARDLMLAVDLSGSMEAEDLVDADGRPVTRLDAVKEVLGEFLSARRGDRVALLVFGNAPFLQVPFTDDLELCRSLLGETQVRMAGPRTMLGDAIGKAVQVFEASELDDKVLILLTDGNDTGSLVEPVKAAAIARDGGIVIHAIAMGDPKSTGEEKFDEETLRKVSETTGGRYFRALDRNELAGVYDEIDRITAHEVETISHRPVTALYHLPLVAALLFSALHPLLLLLPRAEGKPSAAAEPEHA